MKRNNSPFERFYNTETSSSILLLFMTFIALVFANSPWGDVYEKLLQYKLSIGIADSSISKPIILWINDGLMAIFFFVIGLEVKREILAGELSSRRKATLPFIAAIGGMVFPIIIFLILNQDPSADKGWAIPMATDIAFALGILRLLGNRVPHGLKVFLLAFAIVDDLGAILVIAVFYSTSINWGLILIALGILVVLALLTHFRLYSKYLYFVGALVVWYLFLKSGVHATIAGVLMALTIPIKRNLGNQDFVANLGEALSRFLPKPGEKQGTILSHNQIQALDKIEDITEGIQCPLQYLENKLHGWVSFLIMPIFAFANAGVPFIGRPLEHPQVSLAIGLALIFGNLVGISLLSYLGIKSKIAMPIEGVKLKSLIAVSLLGGVGFTMSLFITNLSFTEISYINAAKIGILAGSLLSGLAGYFILKKSFSAKS